MFLWLGIGVRPELVSSLFGVAAVVQVDSDKTFLPDLDNPYSQTVRAFIEETRRQRHRYMRVSHLRLYEETY